MERPRGRGPHRGLAAALVVAIAAGLCGVAWLQTHGGLHALGDVRDRLSAEVAWRLPEAELGAVQVHVDFDGPATAISPSIYGVAQAPGSVVAALGATVDRWGGNSSSRYNWVEGHATNAGRDWGFRSLDAAPGVPGSAADAFVAGALAAGAKPLVTIPSLGWVARSSDQSVASTGVPADGSPAIPGTAGAIAAYDPAVNRARTSVPSYPRKPGPLLDVPDRAAGAVYQDEWVHHLVSAFGGPASGVGYFAVDNEPDLWSRTHTDVHPARAGYDEMLSTYVDYAAAIRAQDPAAPLLGPDLWGWTSLFESDLDRGSGAAAGADRRAHGGVALLEWWLGNLAEAERIGGRRLVDLVDVHYYPQARQVFSAAADPATRALRVRATRSLYDPGYSDESWIGQPVRLLPRLRDMVQATYPGTGIAISEYSWGGERDASGAVAVAAGLGIFGREGVQLACYWPYPAPDSASGAAFRLFRNYDGAGASFGDSGRPARSSASPVMVFAARHSGSSEADVVLVNQSLGQTASVRLDLGSWSAAPLAAFRVAGSSGRIDHLGGGSAADALRLPPLSVTLLRLVRP